VFTAPPPRPRSCRICHGGASVAEMLLGIALIDPGAAGKMPERRPRNLVAIFHWERSRSAAAVSGNSFKLASIRSRQRGPRDRASS